MAHHFFAGTSGLLTPIPKRDFPPEHHNSSRLAFVSTLLNSIEINSSFYKLPKPTTVAKWANEVAGDLKFTYKLWKEITHQKGLVFDPEHVQQFMAAIDHVGDKKGCLLIQFPPSTSVAQAINLQNLLATVQTHNNGWKIAVEFRHASWYNDDVYELLEKYQSSFVINDMPASASPLRSISNEVVYLRFHGPGGRYRGSYEDDILYEYALYIKEWMDDGKDVYVYFNNTAGDALNNLITLKSMVNTY